MEFDLAELAVTLGGRLLTATGDPHDGPDRAATGSVDGVTIDSRGDVTGRLFVPLVAERDGHRFIPAAAEAGAAAYLTAEGPIAGVRLPAIEVADTARALTAIGRLARDRLSGPVIGITGSVGKTSVKDLTLAACRSAGPTWASAASFNNELGVPLTLANAPDDTATTIVEMGARGVGHIAELCTVARPTVGLVTCVALVHSELFGSLEAVAEAKGELIAAIPPSGTAALNADDPLVAAMASRTEARILTWGRRLDGSTVDVAYGDVRTDRLLRPTFTIEHAGSRAEVSLEARGGHMAGNAAAAVAAAVAAGVGFDAAIDGLRSAGVSRWRMEVTAADSGLIVVNDAYNANPTSMRAALRALGELPVDRRVAVLGAMAELGEEGPAEHRAVAAEAAGSGVRVIAVDATDYGDGAHHVPDREAALACLTGLGAGDAVLVKGSRVAGLEWLAERLLAL